MERRSHLEEPDVDVRIILKQIFKLDGTDGIALVQDKGQ
jgi:hypothetical protein